ncbi:MAG: helix-turn-helix transcriptional regulator [Coriobacteriales bacterium]|nr:helix-turn-helix transcriptional regulator [Coriobacteriales bacterium]
MGKRILVFAGFSLFTLTLVLGYYSSFDLIAFTAAQPSERVAFHLLVSGAEAIALCSLAIIFRRDDRAFFAQPLRIAALIALLALLTFALLTWSQQLAGPLPALIGAALAFGCALSLALAFWSAQLVHLSYRGSYLLIIGAHGVATVCGAAFLAYSIRFDGMSLLATMLLSCLCMALLPQAATTTPVASAASAASAAAAAAAASSGEKDGRPPASDTPFSADCSAQPSAQTAVQPPTRPSVREAFPLLRSGVSTVCVFAFISGLVLVHTGGAVSNPSTLQGFMLAASAAVLLIMLIPLVVTHKPLKLENSYRIALPLSTLGFIVVPFLVSGLPAGVAGILVTTGYMLTGIVLYCTVAEASRVTRAPVLPLLAGCEACVLLCYILGSLLSDLLARVVSGSWESVAIIGLALLYLALFFLVPRSVRGRGYEPLSKESTWQPQGAEKGGRVGASFATANIGSLGATHGLLEREAEILALMIEGRTLSRIGEELGLSTSGIKYHAHSLYRKLGVSSRDELRSLVVATGDAAAKAPELSHSKLDMLTLREREVAQLLAQGKAVEAIAGELVISANTAKSHIRTIYSKLDIHSKQELIDLARTPKSDG